MLINAAAAVPTTQSSIAIGSGILLHISGGKPAEACKEVHRNRVSPFDDAVKSTWLVESNETLPPTSRLQTSRHRQKFVAAHAEASQSLDVTTCTHPDNRWDLTLPADQCETQQEAVSNIDQQRETS